jgi:predicted TIM-barrel fold metal-dependent hydrolase
MIIDGDGHYAEPLDVWRDYVSPEFRDRIYVVEGADGFGERIVLDNHVQVLGASRAFDGSGLAAPIGLGDYVTPAGIRPGMKCGRRWEEGAAGGWDPHERLKVHDENGIDAAVLFPGVAGQLGSINDPQVALAAAQAVNRWAADFASVAPDELYPIAVLPDDPELASAELRRCVNEYGFVGGTLRPNPSVGGRTLGDPAWDVLWATVAELDVVLGTHNFDLPDRPQAGRERAKSFMLSHTAVHPFEAMLAFGTMYEAGVFERFPTIRIGYMESGCGWLPFWLDRLEEHMEHLAWLDGLKLTREPQEVFMSQCVLGTENDEPTLPVVQERLHDEIVLWASDYPHFDTDFPLAEPMLRRTDLTPEQLDGAMFRGAVRFYKLDVERIARSNTRRREEASVLSS